MAMISITLLRSCGNLRWQDTGASARAEAFTRTTHNLHRGWMTETLSPEAIRAAIDSVPAGPFGGQVHYHMQCGSTNDLLRDLAEQGAPEGTLVITDEQVQ